MQRYEGITPEDRGVIERAEQIAEHTNDYYDDRKIYAGITASGIVLFALGLGEVYIEHESAISGVTMYFGSLAMIAGTVGGLGRKLIHRHNIHTVD